MAPAKHWFRADLQHMSSVSMGLNELSELYLLASHHYYLSIMKNTPFKKGQNMAYM